MAAGRALAVVLAGGIAVSAAGLAGAHPAARPRRIWVGTLTLRYVRDYEFPRKDGGVTTETQNRFVTITNHANGTATIAATVHNHRESICTLPKQATSYREDWELGGRVPLVSVTFRGTRYQLGFALPGARATVEETTCTETKTTPNAPVTVMPVGFQLYGTAHANATSIAGTWGHYPSCTNACVSLWWEASWNFRLVTASGSGGGSGTRGKVTVRPAGSSRAAGAGCEQHVVNGTPGDDRLAGSAAPDLLRGLEGNDTLDGGDGTDCVLGGPGDDTLAGGTGNDLLRGDAGADRYDAGPGDDEVYARDGAADVIDCGAGTDRAIVDAADTVVGCETVRA
jgi:hypothetical protein